MNSFHKKILEYATLLNALSSGDERALSRAELLREELKGLTLRERGVDGIYWWNIPIADVLEEVEEHRFGDRDDGPWRFRFSCHYDYTDQGIVLLAEEEGHFNSFSSSRYVELSTISKYTDAERAEMVANYNRSIDAHERYKMATTEGPVYSQRYDKVYSSAESYYYSPEHLMDRKLRSDRFADSLVQSKETDTTTVYSNSIHYSSLYSFAEFSVDPSGELVRFGPCEIKRLAANGSGSSHAGQLMENKNPWILLADYLADDSFVKKIGIRQLGRAFYAECSNYTEALHNAAMIAKLGGKLCYEEVEEVNAFITDAEAQRCNELMRKAMSGNKLDEKETIDMLHATVNGALQMEPEGVLLIKTSLLFDLFMLSMEDESERCLFYAELCSNVANAVFPLAQNVEAKKQFTAIAMVTGCFCAEIHMKRKQYESCFVFADRLERAYGALRSTDPGNFFLQKTKLYDKMLKKISKIKKKMR